jgi:hypothetical protein
MTTSAFSPKPAVAWMWAAVAIDDRFENDPVTADAAGAIVERRHRRPDPWVSVGGHTWPAEQQLLKTYTGHVDTGL